MMADGSPLPNWIPKAIPPAWTDVRVATDPKAEVLVTGRDKKGKSQAIYSAEHDLKSAAIKFARIKELDVKKAQIDADLEKDLRSGDPERRENALVLKLIRDTGIRAGGEGNTKAEKQAFGATTLEARHVKVLKRGVELRFVGKKGVDLQISVGDKRLSNELVQRSLSRGRRDRLFDTTYNKLLEFTRTKDGGEFTPKDFRTLKASELSSELVRSMPKPKTEKDYKKAVRAVAKAVSERLGNTPTVALQSYIPPMVFSVWRKAR